MFSISSRLALATCCTMMLASFACTSESPNQSDQFAGSAAGSAGTFGAAGSNAAGSTAAGSIALAGSGGSGGMFGVAGTTPTAGSGPAAGSGGSGGAAGSNTAGTTSEAGSAGTNAADAGPGDDAGSSAYNPCPQTGDPCKILPLGDSITYGLQQEGAYRIELFRQSVLANQNITFVGSQMNGPSMVEGKPFPRNHEGYSGYTIAQIDQQVVDNALSFDPQIITLMIGTNDMYREDPPGAPGRLAGLIDKIIAMTPDALLVVAKLTPAQSFQTTIDTYNAALPAIVKERADAGKHILLVDMAGTEISSDGIHPNAAGYAHMGGIWYAAIKDVLPAL